MSMCLQKNLKVCKSPKCQHSGFTELQLNSPDDFTTLVSDSVQVGNLLEK